MTGCGFDSHSKKEKLGIESCHSTRNSSNSGGSGDQIVLTLGSLYYLQLRHIPHKAYLATCGIWRESEKKMVNK